MKLLFIIEGIISIASIYFMFADHRKHKKILPQVILTAILVITTIGSASIYHPLEKHHTTDEVALIKTRYKSEKRETAELISDRDKLITLEEKAKKKRDKAELAYKEQKPQFEQEAKEKKEAEEKKRQEEEQKKKQEEEQKRKQEEEQRLLAEKQQKEQEERQKQVAQTQQPQQDQNQQQTQNATQTDQMVLIAPNHGRRYHFDSNCRGLRNAKSTITMSLDEATKQGYTRCGFE